MSTIAFAGKITNDWTFLGSNTYSAIKNKGTQDGENEQNRFQAGVAFRDTDSDVWNALARVEHRIENDSTQKDITLRRGVELLSRHANWQPRLPCTFSGRLAAKWVTETSNGVAGKNDAQLISGRAIWEFAPRWDASLNLSTMLGNRGHSKCYRGGVELGFMVMENVWLPAGYNFFGYTDKDLTSGDYTIKGAFVRMRYKFYEDLFPKKKAAILTTKPETILEPINSPVPATAQDSARQVAAAQSPVSFTSVAPPIAPPAVSEVPTAVQAAISEPTCRVSPAAKMKITKISGTITGDAGNAAKKRAKKKVTSFHIAVQPVSQSLGAQRAVHRIRGMRPNRCWTLAMRTMRMCWR